MPPVRPRDLQRRKFQAVAATVIDGHAATLRQHDERLTILTDGLSQLTETVTHNAQTLQTVGGQLFAALPAQPATLGRRLRWLLTGR